MIKHSTIKYLILSLILSLITSWTLYYMLRVERRLPSKFLTFVHQWRANQNQTYGFKLDQKSSKVDLQDSLIRVQSRDIKDVSSKTVERHSAPTTIATLKEITCSANGDKLVGPLYVDQNIIPNIEELEKEFSVSYSGWVEQGGAWKPQDCQSKRKVAIIIPYRNRYEQLKIFLRHIHPILKRQLLDYRIFIIEQAGNTIFNRAILFNIGFKESLKLDNYQCFIFHDVDLLPEDDKNFYGCPSSPRHMCPAVDKFSYRLIYEDLFGGVEAFLKEDFEKINGFSNKYWGWGGEDDDLHHRAVEKGLHITRPSMNVGRYKMLKVLHFVDERKNTTRTTKLLKTSLIRMDKDGLNSLKYNLLKTVSHLLYTHLVAEVDPDAM